MRYFYERPEMTEKRKYGIVISSPHPMYDSCTLFTKEEKGLAIVQKRFDPSKKVFFYSSIDDCLANDIYENDRFDEYFEINSRLPYSDLYPTKEVRSVMWALRMKPLKKEWWEDSRIFYNP